MLSSTYKQSQRTFKLFLRKQGLPTITQSARRSYASSSKAPAEDSKPSHFPSSVEYMDKVQPDSPEAPKKKFTLWNEMTVAEKQHRRMRNKQLKRMKRGLEAYHPVNNSLVSQKLDSYGQVRQSRMPMILFDSVVERGGMFSPANYQKFLKVIGIRSGCFEEAQIVFDHYKKSYPAEEHDLFIYNQMIQVCRGNPQEALNVYRDIQKLDHMIPNTFTFNFLLQSLLKPYVRHTNMKPEEWKEMIQERKIWGSFEAQTEASQGEEESTPEQGAQHAQELRSFLQQILDEIYAYDPIVLANSFVQDTIEKLGQFPVFESFEPLQECRQSSPSSEEPAQDVATKRAIAHRQLAAAYLKTYRRYRKKKADLDLSDKEAEEIQQDMNTKISESL